MKNKTLKNEIEKSRRIREAKHLKINKKLKELAKLIFEMNKDGKIITVSVLANHKQFSGKKKIKRINGLFFERKDLKEEKNEN